MNGGCGKRVFSLPCLHTSCWVITESEHSLSEWLIPYFSNRLAGTTGYSDSIVLPVVILIERARLIISNVTLKIYTEDKRKSIGLLTYLTTIPMFDYLSEDGFSIWWHQIRPLSSLAHDKTVAPFHLSFIVFLLLISLPGIVTSLLPTVCQFFPTHRGNSRAIYWPINKFSLRLK